MKETALVSAYRHTDVYRHPFETLTDDLRSFELGDLTYRPCVCGAWLGLDLSNELAILDGVSRHRLSPRHQIWRAQA
jgi:hypothetical protein